MQLTSLAIKFKEHPLFRYLLMALFIACSLVLFLVEGLIPLPFLAPGAKLGLANIVTIAALYLFPHATDALIIVISRTLLASLFGGGPAILLYSLGGGLFSFITMLSLKNAPCFSIIGVSAAGGFAHNVAQLLIASLLMTDTSILSYLSILGPCGLITGLLLGYLSFSLLAKITL